jgi:RNA polymerase sigma factor (sigma-70 family)
LSSAAVRPLDRQAQDLEARLAEVEPSVRAVARLYYVPGYDRDDLEQLARIAVWRALPAFDGSTALRSFAFTVARREVLDAIEASKRDVRRANHETAPPRRNHDGDLIAPVDVLAEPHTTEELAEGRAELRDLVGKVRRLTPLERLAVAHVVAGIPYTGNAVAGSTSLDNAAQRARRKLLGLPRRRSAA